MDAHHSAATGSASVRVLSEKKKEKTKKPRQSAFPVVERYYFWSRPVPGGPRRRWVAGAPGVCHEHPSKQSSSSSTAHFWRFLFFVCFGGAAVVPAGRHRTVGDSQ